MYFGLSLSFAEEAEEAVLLLIVYQTDQGVKAIQYFVLSLRCAKAGVEAVVTRD